MCNIILLTHNYKSVYLNIFKYELSIKVFDTWIYNKKVSYIIKKNQIIRNTLTDFICYICKLTVSLKNRWEKIQKLELKLIIFNVDFVNEI